MGLFTAGAAERGLVLVFFYALLDGGSGSGHQDNNNNNNRSAGSEQKGRGEKKRMKRRSATCAGHRFFYQAACPPRHKPHDQAMPSLPISTVYIIDISPTLTLGPSSALGGIYGYRNQPSLESPGRNGGTRDADTCFVWRSPTVYIVCPVYPPRLIPWKRSI